MHSRASRDSEMKHRRILSPWPSLKKRMCIFFLLLLFSTVSFAAPDSSATIFSPSPDCHLAHNPDDCYRKQSQQQWTTYTPTLSALPALSTQTWGLEGPFSADLRYDDLLSWVFGFKYLYMLSESAGVGAKLTAGANELRANLTAGYAFTKDQQVKFTYEYLTQNLPFDFASGATHEWVKQHALGASYQYVIRHAILDSLELSAYAIRAKSKDLQNLAFNQQEMDGGQGYFYDVNYRRIAGGKENNVLASLNLFPFANDRTRLTLGGGYSTIRYDTAYENNQAAAHPSYKVQLSQLLGRKAKIEIGSTGSAASVEHSLGLSYLLPRKMEASLKGQYTTGLGGLGDNRSITLGLLYPSVEQYSLAALDAAKELKNWIDTPVLYATRVLAIKDEMVKRYEFSTKNLTLVDQLKRFTELLSAVPTSFAFTFTDPDIAVQYSITTTKESPAPETTSDADRDFTEALHLELVPNGQNQAILQSREGIPAVDNEGKSTVGVYRITLTASGTAAGLRPITLTNGFKLTVMGGAPMWDTKHLPDGYMGFPYGSSPVSEHISTSSPSDGVDLTAKLTLQGSDTAVDIAMEDTAACVHPSWVELQACPSPNQGHQCLFGTTHALPTPIPNDQDLSQVCMHFTAKGVPSGETADATFTPQIVQEKPLLQLPTTALALKADLSSPPIDLNSYLVGGKTGVDFQKGADFHPSFSLNDPSAGKLKLHTTPANLGRYTLPVRISNSTSYGPSPQTIPVDVVNSSYTVGWTKTTLPHAKAGIAYNQALNPMGLLQTQDSTGTLVPNDVYTFERVSSSDPQWTVSPDGQNLVYGNGTTDLPSEGTVTLILTSTTSEFSGEKPSSGGNQDNSQHNQYTLTIDPNPAFTVHWTAKTEIPVVGGVAYNQALNPMGLLETKDSTGTIVPNDIYTFERVSSSDPKWTVSPDGKNLVYGNGTTDLPSAGTVSLILTSTTSKFSGKRPSSGGNQREAENNKYTFDILLPPQFKPNQTAAIPFDRTGEESDNGLGLITQGIPLNSMLTTNSQNLFKEITFSFEGEARTSGNWEIKQDPGNLSQYYLLRKLTVLAGTDPTVDASDVGSVVAIPKIKVCGIPISSERGERLCGYSNAPGTSDPIQVSVQPDDKILYQYVPAIPTAKAGIELVSVSSDGAGGRASTYVQTVQFPPPSSNYDTDIPRFVVSPHAPNDLSQKRAKVVGDSDTAFLKPASVSAYIEYGDLSTPRTLITGFKAPTGLEFPALVAKGESSYLDMRSKANSPAGGGSAAHGRLIDLPPITTNTLILVPSKGTLNQGFTPGNMGSNIGVGINNVSSRICNEPLTNSTLTALAFDLPPLPAGDTRNYVLARASTTPAPNQVGICAGTSAAGGFLPLSTPDTQAGKCGVSNAYTWDASNIMGSNTPSTYCKAAGGGSYIPFQSTASAPLGKGGNYTLFALQMDMNSGVAYPNNSDIPDSYLPNMTARGTRKTALMFGSSTDYNTTNYVGFPMVTLR
jgi:hypothetical protein